MKYFLPVASAWQVAIKGKLKTKMTAQPLKEEYLPELVNIDRRVDLRIARCSGF